MRSPFRVVGSLLVVFVAVACSGTAPVQAPDRLALRASVLGSVQPAPARTSLHITWQGINFPSPKVGFLSTCAPSAHRCDTPFLVTRDGGRTWRQDPNPRAWRFQFLTPTLGFASHSSCTHRACAVTIQRTLDGGRTERAVGTTSVASRNADVAGVRLTFADAAHGLLAVGTTLEGTTDGGRTWTPLPLQCPSWAPNVTSISMASTTTAFVSCEGEPATDMGPKAVERSTDGGRTWTVVSASPSPVVGMPVGHLGIIGYGSRLSFMSSNLGFLMSSRAGISETTDGGVTFHSLLFTDDTEDVTGAWFSSPTHGFVSLLQSGLYRTHDAGATWTHVWPRPTPFPVGPTAFADGSNGLGVGKGGFFFSDPGAVYGTHDGGTTWARVGSLGPSSPDGLTFVDARTAIGAAVVGGNHARHIIVRTTDAGKTWARIPGPVRIGWGPDVVNAGTWFQYGRNANIYRTTDAGKTWQMTGHLEHISALAFTSAMNGWVLRYNRDVHIGSITVARTTDAGKTWSFVQQSPQFRPFALTFIDPQHGWMAGDWCGNLASPDPNPTHPWCVTKVEPALMRTTDGGATWALIHYQGIGPLEELNFVSPLVGFAPIDGSLYRTDDGGTTWTYVGTPALTH